MLVCMVVSAVVILSLLQTSPQCNSASRLATVESLVHRGTFAIDGSPFAGTADRVLIDGRYYSSKPPLLSVLAAGGYLAFSSLTGMDFASHPSEATAFVNLLVGALPYLLTLYFFYRLLIIWTDSYRGVVLGLLVFTFNFIGLGYAVDINNHTPAAACLLISFYLAYRTRHGTGGGRVDWVLSGLLAGLASTFEFWAGFFALAFLVYLYRSDGRRAMLLFLPAAAVPVAAHFLLSLASTGSLLPVYLRPDLYQFQEGYWTAPAGIDALHEPKHIYFFNILLGHHGLFSMTPVFLLAAWSMVRNSARGSPKREEVFTVGVPVLAALVFLGLRTRNYGGICAGLRWMILSMPLLFLFVASWIEEHRSRGAMILLGALFLIGLVMLADVPWANAGPWHNSAFHKYVFGLY